MYRDRASPDPAQAARVKRARVRAALLHLLDRQTLKLQERRVVRHECATFSIDVAHAALAQQSCDVSSEARVHSGTAQQLAHRLRAGKRFGRIERRIRRQRQPVEIFDHEPAAGLECSDHAIEHLFTRRQVTQQQPRVDEIEGFLGQRPLDDVVSHDAQVVLREAREESRVQVRRQH